MYILDLIVYYSYVLYVIYIVYYIVYHLRIE